MLSRPKQGSVARAFDGEHVVTRIVEPRELKRRLAEPGEIAFLDVREAGQFGEGHPFLAIPAPYSRLEIDVPRLVPRRSTPVVLFDAGDGVAERASEALAAIGYTDVSISRDGAEGWRTAGYVLFEGVNLPSKTFGEMVEHACHTPRLSAADLSRRLGSGETIAILDGRPFAEFRKMSIPGAVCCPNGELALRVRDLVPDASTPIVVNCAGRTRSIIGAQTLIDMGVPNPVYALENGTQGWYLEGLPLRHGRTETYPPSGGTPAAGIQEQAEVLAADAAVTRLDRTTFAAWTADEERTTFVLDVRSPEEALADPVPDAIAAPGGQLIQATDQYVGTRGARLVLIDTDGVRAPMVATWLRRLGHEAHFVARADVSPLRVPGELPRLPEVDAGALRQEAPRPRILDLRPSEHFRRAHIEGAEWSIRPRLRTADGPVVLVADEPAVAAIAVRDLGVPARRLAGGPDEWQRAGFTIRATPDEPADSERIDFLFFVHDRHDGNKAAARRYLQWETGLVARIDEDERAIFRLPGRS